MSNTTTRVRQVPDLSLEGWFRDNDISFEYVSEFPISDIDEDSSLKIQSRVETREGVTVGNYVSQMQEGDLFPAIVVYELNGKIVVPSGLHRLGALKRLNQSTSSVYLVDPTTPAEKMEDLALWSNTSHGRDLTSGELMMWATKYNSKGYSGDRLASVLNITPTTAYRMMRIARGQTRYVETLGGSMNVWAKVNQGNCNELSGVMLDEIFKPMVDICSKYQPETKLVKAVCKKLNDATSVEAKEAIVADFEDTLAEAIKAKKKTGPKRVTASSRKRQADWGRFNLNSGALAIIPASSIVSSIPLGDIEVTAKVRENAMSTMAKCAEVIRLLDEASIG